ncbi:hypothetical protein HK098_001765 [Nowakowskiella sp. JEL0407]|nr:hypothetical protein HK098_001765 [Nowakowskiella sp. JEL0407]
MTISEKQETLTHVDLTPPPLPPYTETATKSASFKALELINIDKSKKRIAFGPNTANPIFPETISGTVKWGELVLDLTQLPSGSVVNIDLKIKFSTVILVVSEGVLVKDDLAVSMADSKDKRTNFALRDGHSSIFVTGTIKFGEFNIVDDIAMAGSKGK